MRTRIRETIEAIVEEELEAALAAEKSARVGADRQGYRHGTRERTLTTSLGPTTFAMPRARLRAGEGTTTEWRSTTVARYQRRTARVDEALLGVYLAGTNTRRLKGALAPLRRGGPLSKDAVSRLVGRLRDDFETWRTRDLAAEDIRYLFLDGWFPKVRIGGRRARVPVLVTLGVRGDGQRVVLDLRLAGEESAASWGAVLASLGARHLRRPMLAVVDGNPGLLAALQRQWPGLAIQRCTAHKLRNLQAKAPARLREELTEEYRRMIYAETVPAVEQAGARFTKKWQLRCPAVVESLKEAGDELFTFLRFPRSQWKALRTTDEIDKDFLTYVSLVRKRPGASTHTAAEQAPHQERGPRRRLVEEARNSAIRRVRHGVGMARALASWPRVSRRRALPVRRWRARGHAVA